MSNKRNPKSQESRSKKVQFQGFLSLKLSPQEKEAIKSNLVPLDGVLDVLTSAVFAGYKVSLSFNPRRDSYVLTVYGNTVDHPDAGWAMTIFHRDAHVAVSALYWCLDQVGKGGSLTEWLGTDDSDDW
jgi:hypothetical protein